MLGHTDTSFVTADCLQLPAHAPIPGLQEAHCGGRSRGGHGGRGGQAPRSRSSLHLETQAVLVSASLGPNRTYGPRLPQRRNTTASHRGCLLLAASWRKQIWS